MIFFQNEKKLDRGKKTLTINGCVFFGEIILSNSGKNIYVFFVCNNNMYIIHHILKHRA